jgi:hypothetical protein
MDNPWDTMRAAITQAKGVLAAKNTLIWQMGDLLCGNLRHCHSDTLVKLKRELRDFDAHTKRWKS